MRDGPARRCDVVDFPDATLLPGLIDTHVHLCGDGGLGVLDRLPTFSDEEMTAVIEDSLRAHLACGVTTVRDLGDRSWAVIDWRDRHRSSIAVPTVLASGPPITSPGVHCWNMGGQARGADELRHGVEQRLERGVDIVKIMASGGSARRAPMRSPPSSRSRNCVWSSRRPTLPVAGHRPCASCECDPRCDRRWRRRHRTRHIRHRKRHQGV